MRVLFCIAAFLSALLLFLIQPMIAKMLLPRFGGSAAVWTSCVVFFQGALLMAYLYAHVATKQLTARRQALVHVLLLIAPLFLLPFLLPEPTSGNPRHPALVVLKTLTGSIGLPFFVVATSAPLLQRWFTLLGSSRNPYFLYAASNVGSLLALLGYPTLVEPFVPLPRQALLWSLGYGLLVLLIAGCAAALWRSPVLLAEKDASERAQPEPLPPQSAVWWVVLSLVPSSLMLGVTSYLTTDVSPAPMLWVLPLSLYLLTFIIAFSNAPAWTSQVAATALFVLVLVWVAAQPGRWLAIALHLGMFCAAALACHCELARRRPAVTHLTAFYLYVALGGALGGMFNALVSPVLFTALVEYPVMIVLACILAPGPLRRFAQTWHWREIRLPAALGGAFVVLFLIFPGSGAAWKSIVAACLCAVLFPWPLRFGLGVGILLLAQYAGRERTTETLYSARNYFGIVRVLRNPRNEVHWLVHGNVEHGAQRYAADPELRRLPLLYYDPTGPIGRLFQTNLKAGKTPPVAIVGLGAGALASYGEAGQEMTFFEIDPTVARVAQNPAFFSYLSQGAADTRIVIGDARLCLRNEEDDHYGVIVVDAFSSDAIPVHLLTCEAMDLYFRKLSRKGVVALHISNQFLDLEPVIRGLANQKELKGLSCREAPADLSEAEVRRGKRASHWILLARCEDDLALYAADPHWKPLKPQGEDPVWTDDFSNILGVVRWR